MKSYRETRPDLFLDIYVFKYYKTVPHWFIDQSFYNLKLIFKGKKIFGDLGRLQAIKEDLKMYKLCLLEIKKRKK